MVYFCFKVSAFGLAIEVQMGHQHRDFKRSLRLSANPISTKPVSTTLKYNAFPILIGESENHVAFKAVIEILLKSVFFAKIQRFSLQLKDPKFIQNLFTIIKKIFVEIVNCNFE